jgi:hypothetical protein
VKDELLAVEVDGAVVRGDVTAGAVVEGDVAIGAVVLEEDGADARLGNARGASIVGSM